MIFLNLFLFATGVLLLVKGSDYFIEKLKFIAKSLNVSEIIIGILLGSIATTLPEISVSFVSSLQGKSSLALGNALGSVLINTSLIIGIPSFFVPIKVDDEGWKNALLLLLFSIILLIMSIDKNLSRWEGALLLVFYILFVRHNIFLGNKNKRGNSSEVYKKDIVYVFILAGIVVLGSKLLVDSAVFFAKILGISEMIIGLTIVAFGTSLPEFVNTLNSIIKRTPNIGIGNILGANVMNLLVVIGIASLINPIQVEEKFLYLTMPLMMVIIAVLTISLKRDNIIGRKTGFLLLCLYSLFFLLSLL